MKSGTPLVRRGEKTQISPRLLQLLSSECKCLDWQEKAEVSPPPPSVTQQISIPMEFGPRWMKVGRKLMWAGRECQLWARAPPPCQANEFMSKTNGGLITFTPEARFSWVFNLTKAADWSLSISLTQGCICKIEQTPPLQPKQSLVGASAVNPHSIQTLFLFD